MKNNSKKEIYLLIGLLVLLVAIVYYMVLYPPLKNKLSDARNDKARAIAEYDRVTEELATLDLRKSEIKSQKGAALNQSNRFYPDIIEENLIIELEEMANATNFQCNFTLDSVKVSALEDMTPNNADLPESSFDSLNDAINEADKALKSNGTVKDTDINKNTNIATDTVNGANNTQATSKTSQGACKVLSINLSYSDQDYKNLKDFLYKLEHYDRIVAVTDLQAGCSDKANKIAGSLNIELYALPKINGNDDENYSVWTKKDAAGKEELFAQGAATGAKAKKETDEIDFVCILKQPGSVYPTVTFGKNGDKDTSSYVYADSDRSVKGTITFTEDKDGNYYYKYSIGSSNYPKSTMGDGEKFEPSNNSIDIKVNSDARDGNKDKSGLDLTIVNNTKLPVNVKLNDDSKVNPRFTETSKGTGSVYKK